MLLKERQFIQRLRAWSEELGRQLFTPVAPILFEGFETAEILRPSEAEKRAFSPCPPGTKWGRKWHYGWFRAAFSVPSEAEGKRLVLISGLDGEQLFYLNGSAAGSVDKGHPFVTLSRKSEAGDVYSILCESYAGHGPRLESLGPCPPERRPVPEPPETQCCVRESFAAVWNEEAYQLKMDTDTLTELLRTLPENSLRAMRVSEALDQLTRTVDLELPPAERTAAYAAGRALLRPLLECRNGSTAPTMCLIGQSHIDLAWLWPMEETFHKAVRTYSTQLALLEEYPFYRWLLVEPQLLEMLRERDPEVWDRVRKAFDRGQICPEGAFWVECDTNLPSGESLIRQLQWGKQWFRKEFGVDSKVAFLPDCFGFSGALPQILSKLGIPYFATQKLLRADPECERFPYQHFTWEGIDGSCVAALSFMRDNGPVSPYTFYQRWDLERTQKNFIDTMLHPFGYGDGGGGPTRDMVEMTRRLKDLEGVARGEYTGLREFFDRTAARAEKNRWTGELYLAWHRGTWTSQRRQKQLMRRAEEALHNAELFIAQLPGDSRPAGALRPLWEKLLFCQFHDVAGGVGIERVHQEAEAALSACIAEADALTDAALDRLCGRAGEKAPAVLNTLPWTREEYLRTEDGRWLYVRVPASGTAPLRPLPGPADARALETPDGILMENRFLSLLIAKDGSLTRVRDLETGLDLLSPGRKMNDWRLYANVQPVYDAWEMDRDWETRLLPDAFSVTVRLVRNGPEGCEAEIRRTFSHSSAVQTVRLAASSRRVDFETRMDWQERHRMLKAHFESTVLCDNALHETQFGYVQRPCHRSTPYASDRYEVPNLHYSALCEEDRGFALLNNGIYAVSSNRGELALTLNRAPLVPCETNNRGPHHFTYSLYVFSGPFSQSGTARQGYLLNHPLRILEKCCREYRGPSLESDTLILETVRPDPESGGLFLRFYESARTHGKGILRLPFRAAFYACGLADERPTRQAPLCTGDSVPVAAGPFEIVTLYAVPVS